MTGRSLVQRSPTDCGVSECDHEASILKRPAGPLGVGGAIAPKDIIKVNSQYYQYVQCASFAVESLAGTVILIHRVPSVHLYTFIRYCFECCFLFSLSVAVVYIMTLVNTADVFRIALPCLRTATFAAEMVQPVDSALECVPFFSPSRDANFTGT